MDRSVRTIRYVSEAIHVTRSDLHYRGTVPADPNALRQLADLIRTSREARTWSQNDLARASTVSRPTIQRYEQRKTAVPQPQHLRLIFEALGLDVRRIPVVLGYVTAEEMGIPPEAPPPMPADVQDIAAILTDPDVDPDVKADLVEMLRLSARQARARGRRAG